MSLVPAMFQYIRKLVGANEEKQLAFAPLATSFTNDDFLFMNSEVFQKDPTRFYAESLEFSQKANSIIRKPNIWEIDSSDFLYTKFDEILNNARLIEERDYTDAERAAQAKGKIVLYGPDNKPTAAFKTYKVYEQQFNEIKGKVDAHKNSKPTEPQAAIDTWNVIQTQYESELRDKDLEWNAIGRKVEIGNAIKAFSKPKDNVEREVFAAKWEEAKNFMGMIKTSSVIAGSAIFPMECIPNNLYKYRGTTWSKVSLSKEDIKTLTDELKQTSGTIDIATIFGDAPIELDKLSFEICRVIFSRSWLNESILTSRYWNYSGTVSTGEKDNFGGEIPAYPTEFVLVKNVDFVLTSNSPVNEVFKSNLKTGLSLNVGPFILKNAFTDAAPNRPVRVQTFTSTQVKVMATALNRNTIIADKAVPQVKDLQTIRQFIVRDHRTPTVAAERIAIAPPVELGERRMSPIILRDHRAGPISLPPHPPTRAGFVWVPATDSVAGHWERERAGGPAANVETGKIAGKIVDENNHPITDAEVTILSTSSPVLQNDLTDQNGAFTIENVLKGNYHVTVKKDGYSVIEKEIAIAGNIDMGSMNLSSNNPTESFLLLGVVYKKLSKLPNPLPNEVYT